jgi:hypothetical protein
MNINSAQQTKDIQNRVVWRKPENPEPVCPCIFDKIANPIIEELMTC